MCCALLAFAGPSSDPEKPTILIWEGGEKGLNGSWASRKGKSACHAARLILLMSTVIMLPVINSQANDQGDVRRENGPTSPEN